MGSSRSRLAELLPYADNARGLQGWLLDVRAEPLGPGPPWDYESRAGRLLPTAGSVLDMGTGGGERFSEICRGYAGRAVATEEWPPNVPVASARLATMGVQVVRASSLHLPFGAGAFDLVLNRHEELDPAEVARVLAPGGRFLTQQVRSDNWREIGDFFPRMTDFGPLFQLYRQGLGEAGLKIVYADTHERQTAFGGLGDIVYLLTAATWTVPDFDVERDLDALLALERGLTGDQGIVLTETRYIIEAFKPSKMVSPAGPI